MLRLVVGLGNPTPKYARTRHNVGREFIDFLASEKNSQTPDFLAKSLDCFMNESGGPVKKLMMKTNAKPDEILIVVDDFMIPFGTLRLRSNGSSGGHNGLNSIIDTLGTDEFPRLRVGVGPVPAGQDPADFVLERFTKAEQKKLPDIFNAIKVAVTGLAENGIEKTMNAINKNHLA